MYMLTFEVFFRAENHHMKSPHHGPPPSPSSFLQGSYLFCGVHWLAFGLCFVFSSCDHPASSPQTEMLLWASLPSVDYTMPTPLRSQNPTDEVDLWPVNLVRYNIHHSINNKIDSTTVTSVTTTYA